MDPKYVWIGLILMVLAILVILAFQGKIGGFLMEGIPKFRP